MQGHPRTIFTLTSFASSKEFYQVIVGEVAQYPLRPNDVVFARMGREILQSRDEASIQLRAVWQRRELGLGLLDKVSVELDHVHFVEKRQKEILGNASDSSATV